MTLVEIAAQLSTEMARLTFEPPVTHVYNPLRYARPAFDEYIKR